jgi:hypothetical protein
VHARTLNPPLPCHAARLQRRTGSARSSLGPIEKEKEKKKEKKKVVFKKKKKKSMTTSNFVLFFVFVHSCPIAIINDP